MDQRHEALAREMTRCAQELREAVSADAVFRDLPYDQLVAQHATNFLKHAEAAAERAGLPLAVALALPWLRVDVRV